MWPKHPPKLRSGAVAPNEKPAADAWYFPCTDQGVIGRPEAGVLQPLTADEFRWVDMEVVSRHYLGMLDGRESWALSVNGTTPTNFEAGTLWQWLGVPRAEVFYLAGRARQIVDFHQTHRFCGRCGTQTGLQTTEHGRHCPTCRLVVYPRLSPSIIVLVTRGDEVLLGRQASWPPGMYSTLAGFVEPGESIEETVHREVMEEVGVQLGELEYLGSQSWPFPNSLMLGFHAEYAGGDIVLQPEEIEDAKWFRHDELPFVPNVNAISRWLIDEYVNRQRQSH